MDRHTRRAVIAIRRWIRHQWDKAQFHAARQKAQGLYAEGRYHDYAQQMAFIHRRWLR